MNPTLQTTMVAFAAGTPIHTRLAAIAARHQIRDWELLTFCEFAAAVASRTPSVPCT
jgi:hypothetical protein